MSRTTCDTSVLVPALVGWHPDHEVARDAMRDVDCLVGHVLVETYSVLTRLPSPHRVAPQDAGSVLRSLSFEVLTLPSSQHQPLLGLLAGRGIRGGAVYDGLVAATARHHGCTLLTRDRRARSTYDAVGATYTLG